MSRQSIVKIALIAACILFSYNWYAERKSTAAINKTLIAANDSLSHYKTKYNEEVATRQSIIIKNDKLKFVSDSLQQVIDRFKKPENVIEYRYITKTDSIFIPVFRDKDSDPFEFKYQDKWYDISGTVLPAGIKLNPLIVRDELDIVAGWKKAGFLKKEYSIDIKHSNPYVQNQQVQHYVIIKDQKWHEKWYITGPIGIGVGLLIK